MKDYLPLVIVGLATGSAYALAGLGLVVTYTTSGIFNFAQGTVAAAGAYAYYEFRVQLGLPTPVAIVLTLGVVAPLAGLGFEVLGRRLAGTPTSAKIVASVGMLLAIRGIAVVRYGNDPLPFPKLLPSGQFDLAGVSVGYDQLVVVLIAASVGVALGIFFKRTTTGIAMRAVVDDPDLVGLAGTSPTAVRRLAWVIGSVFAALAGILIAPFLGLDATLLTLLVVQAFGGAAFGRFRSLPLTYVGCVVVGILGALSTRLIVNFDQPILTGLPPSVPFLVLIVVLLISPATDLGTEVARRSDAGSTNLPPAVRNVGVGLAAVVIAVAPLLQPSRTPVFTAALSLVVLFLSLGLLVRTSGQVSLAHAGFFAVGAAAYGHLTTTFDLPWPVALVGAGLLTVPIGLAVALPAIRLSGLYVALATFGFGILLQRLGYSSFLMFGRDSTLEAPRPSFARSDNAYYWTVCVVVALAAAGVYWIRASRLGRLLRAMAGAPVALAVGGTDVKSLRAIVLAISAFLAGVAGALFGPGTTVVSGSSFDPFNSLLYLTVLAIAGFGEIRAAFVAAALIGLGPTYLADTAFVDYLPVIFGVAAIYASVPHKPLAMPNDPTAMQRRLAARQAPARREPSMTLEPT